jgi:hypothetical protein
MTAPEIAAEGAHIVVVGNFNPAIFSPAWFEANDLLSAEDVSDSRPEAIVPQLSIFEVAWLRCEVTLGRMSLSTSDPQEYGRLRDLALGVLETLPHTPVSALGMNRYYHFGVPSVTAWHRVGDTFAPKDRWEGVLVLPGMRDVTVSGVRTDAYGGFINVSIQPSNLFPLGVFVAQNDHCNLVRVERQPESRDDFVDASFADMGQVPTPSAKNIDIASEILTTEWEASLRRADTLLDLVWKAVSE